MSDCICPSRGETPHSIDCPADVAPAAREASAGAPAAPVAGEVCACGHDITDHGSPDVVGCIYCRNCTEFVERSTYVPTARRTMQPWHLPSDSGEPATDYERSNLRMDGLWDDSHYPEFSQADVLRAYRLGHEDGTP